MQDGRRWAFGATGVACAVLGIASTAFGGAVGCRNDDDREAVVASGEGRSCEWVANIMGESYIAPHIVCAAPAEEEHPIELTTRIESTDGVSSASAAVIPLPPPVWSGVLGLSALAIGSGVRQLRRFV
jgi:hypothetical protein